MNQPYVDLERVNEADELASAAASFANAAYDLTKQLGANEIPDAAWTFYIMEREKLHEALAGIRDFAIGMDRDLDRLQSYYIVASYGVTLVASYVVKCKQYTIYPLGNAQQEFADLMLRTLCENR